MFTLMTILFFLVPYLLGSIPAAVWISKGMYGVDIRTLGSFNAGSTNMFEQLGFKAGALTQVVDIAKGAAAAAFPFLLIEVCPGHCHGLSLQDRELQSIICGLIAVLGHIYPVFAGFRGGKGINTLLGMMLVTNPIASGICLLVWLLILYITRYVALASMLAVLAYPLWLLVFAQIRGLPINPILLSVGFAMFVLVVYTHRSNISRLLKGTEGYTNWLRKGKEGK